VREFPTTHPSVQKDNHLGNYFFLSFRGFLKAVLALSEPKPSFCKANDPLFVLHKERGNVSSPGSLTRSITTIWVSEERIPEKFLCTGISRTSRNNA